MLLAQHPTGYSAYDASCSKMNLARRTILGSLTDTSHEFEVPDTHSVLQIAVQYVERLQMKEEKKKEINRQSKLSPVIDHRGTPSSHPTSFKHSLANTRASNDTTWPRFEPAPLPVLIVLAAVDAWVGLPPWLI